MVIKDKPLSSIKADIVHAFLSVSPAHGLMSTVPTPSLLDGPTRLLMALWPRTRVQGWCWGGCEHRVPSVDASGLEAASVPLLILQGSGLGKSRHPQRPRKDHHSQHGPQSSLSPSPLTQALSWARPLWGLLGHVPAPVRPGPPLGWPCLSDTALGWGPCSWVA